jgi:putative ABC transport system permease protein
MLLNYLSVAVRSIKRNVLTQVLNVFGLAFGLACCILCYLHIQYELDFDKFNENDSRIMRLVRGAIQNEDYWVKVAAPIPPYLKENIQEIEAFSRFSNVSYAPQVVVQGNGKSFSEPYFMMADPDFFKIFSFRVLKGSADHALSDLSSVALTETTARKLFGEDDPIGKTILLTDTNVEFQVSAIIEDVPAQSHLHFDYLVSFENLGRLMGEDYVQSWGAYNFFNYFLLQKGVNVQTVEEKVRQVSATTPQGNPVSFQNLSLQPLHDIHFRYNRGNQRPSYDLKYIYIFASMTIGLLIIACINYVNLAISMAIRRVKEIGVRKAIGAANRQLTIQFMSEAFLIVFTGLLLSLYLVHILLPIWNNMMESSIILNFANGEFILYLTLILAAVVVVSGSYLSIFARSYKTTHILKSGLHPSSSGLSLQNSLLLVQFSLSMILISSTIIIAKQLYFIENKDLGLRYNQVLTVPLFGINDADKIKTLKHELESSTKVISASSCSFIPGRANWHQTILWEGQHEGVSMDVLVVDHDFLNTFGIELLEGDLERIRAADGVQYLINESALNYIGWQAGLGKMLSAHGEAAMKPIAGVVKDFNYKSLHHGLDPMVMWVSPDHRHNQLAIKITGVDIPGTLEFIQSKFSSQFSGVPFEFRFMDDAFNQLYKSESRLGTLLFYLTVISILLALVGLYGLLSVTIENKTKEIAVRKVLGISFSGLVLLFSRRFISLFFIASAISVPLIIYVLDNWLNNFTYRVDIEPLWLIAAFLGLSMVLIGVILLRSMMFQNINPSVALKYE